MEQDRTDASVTNCNYIEPNHEGVPKDRTLLTLSDGAGVQFHGIYARNCRLQTRLPAETIEVGCR
jgi:hypothetical protein